LGDDRPLVGDRVSVRLISPNEGIIEEIDNRRNQLIRPPIANIYQVVVVMAFAAPKPNLLFLDRLLAVIALNELSIVICFNKWDLAEEDNSLVELYKQAGYTVVVTSVTTQKGIDELKRLLIGKV